MPLNETVIPALDIDEFLAKPGLGRKYIEFQPNQFLFQQGDPADRVFFLQKGRARLTIDSSEGKETTIAIISAGEFVGEECLVAFHGLRHVHRDHCRRLHSPRNKQG